MNMTLFADDPITWSDPSPYAALEFYGHLIIGAIWFFAGVLAFSARKGSKVHILAGQVCIVGTLVVCITAMVMLAVEFAPPLALNSVTAPYAVLTAWLALKPATRRVKAAEYTLSIVEIIALSLFLTIAIPNVLAGSAPPVGPFIVAIIPIALLLGDLNFHLRPAQRAKMRVRRHLARMAWAFAIMLRAPLVEFHTGGFLPLPDLVIFFAPLLIGVGLLLYFQWRFGKLPLQKPRSPSSRVAAGA